MNREPTKRTRQPLPGRRQFLSALGTGAGLACAAGLPLPSLGAESTSALSKRILLETLAAAGKPAQVVTNPDGTDVLLLPHGGRVLGLFAKGSDENFYWTHPALRTVETASAFYAGTDWHNSGGDRTWLAPEVDVFLPDYPSREKYFQPRELDPGNYRVSGEGTSLRLVNRLTLTLSRGRKQVELEISKSLAPAPNPLRHETNGMAADIEYAGYTQHTSLAIVGGDRTSPVGLWNLVQMPHGGELLLPTFSRTEPRLIFGNIPAADLVVEDRLVRYRMRQAGEHKIALRAATVTGRVAYLFQQGCRRALIIRNFVVNPSGEYVDVPWDDPSDFGYSTQACNVNSGLGQFSELEYHIPAIGGNTGRMRCEDVAQVWAFRGPQQPVLDITRRLVAGDHFAIRPNGCPAQE
ncbi:MAG: hypothetical protein FJ276_16030 [Planctomycetes bacterium]|nr:hypothetical protein [Planctomycetota bacterium]